MFLDKLTDSERQILVNLMMILSMADHRLAIREITYLKSIASKYNIDLNKPSHQDNEVELLCKEIQRDCAKIIMLVELIHLARIDTVYDNAERQFIENVRSFFGITKAKLHEIDYWVKDQAAITSRGIKIITCINTIGPGLHKCTS